MAVLAVTEALLDDERTLDILSIPGYKFVANVGIEAIYCEFLNHNFF